MNTLQNKLRTIPHLPFPIFFDHEKIKKEIENIPYQPKTYVSGLRNGISMDLFKEENWYSYSLYSISGNVYSDPEEPWTGDFKQTELIKYCPFTYETLHSVGGGKLLSRIEKILPGQSAGWHSHVMEGFQSESVLTMHLPIIIPKECKYSVISYMDYRGSDYLNPIKVYESAYTEGQVWCLNSYHYHNAFNYSDIPMVMIRFYIDISDQKNYEMVEKAVNEYTGEYIETYENYLYRLENS